MRFNCSSPRILRLRQCGGELCLSVRSAPHASLDRSKPVGFQSHILDGVLPAAKIIANLDLYERRGARLTD